MSAFRNGKTPKPYERHAAPTDQLWSHDMADDSAVATRGKPNNPPINSKLVVSNLHYEITPKDLASIFGQIGTLVREPLIRYDRSGRSSGVAIISYETSTEATKAKNQFNGVLAKGQPMSIAYDTFRPRRAASGSSLIDRIQKPPLMNRLSKSGDAKKAPLGPRAGAGQIRPRSARGRKGASEKKVPKSVQDLDKELDAFMSDVKEDGTAVPVAATQSDGDVDMA